MHHEGRGEEGLTRTLKEQAMSHAGIEQGNAALMQAVREGHAQAAAECYTEDARFLAPNLEALSGREAIAGFFRGTLEMGVRALELNTLEVDDLGDTAIETGEYRLLVEDDQVLDVGKYIVVWKNRDGAWRLHRDIINTSMPPP